MANLILGFLQRISQKISNSWKVERTSNLQTAAINKIKNDINTTNYSSRMFKNKKNAFMKEYFQRYKHASPTLVIDCQFQHLLSNKEMVSLVQQIAVSIGVSKKYQDMCKLVVTDYRDKVQKIAESKNSEEWGIDLFPQHYRSIFKTEDIVYLTPNSENTLQSIDKSKVYVIGGVVDKIIKKNLTMEKAQADGVQTARLPITNNIDLRSSHILNINTIVEIISQVNNGAQWKAALLESIPKRKQEQNQDADESQTYDGYIKKLHLNEKIQQEIDVNNAQQTKKYLFQQMQQQKSHFNTQQDQIKDFDSQSNLNYTNINKNEINHKISIAPMMDVTNSHFRVFMRLLTRKTVNYTEMINENAIIYNRHATNQLLKFNQIEKPLVVQIGGSDPAKSAMAAQICEEMGYDEINFNLGCPSPRVQENLVGACLMKHPQLYVQILKAMRSKVSIPVTVKCRVGVDDFDSYQFFYEFIDRIQNETGITHFIVHARKAFLQGLSPEQNRHVPPLQYDKVLKIKQDFPHLNFTINGGFINTKQISDILKDENGLTGCMVGRLSFKNPWTLSNFDNLYFGQANPGFSRKEAILLYAQYCDEVQSENPKVSHATLAKPLLPIFYMEREAKLFKRMIDEGIRKEIRFSTLISNCVSIFESANVDAANLKPPL